ncbi:hypothetical protein KJ693_10905 [bacterium]|nr:hypothetical protein [bacterium]
MEELFVLAALAVLIFIPYQWNKINKELRKEEQHTSLWGSLLDGISELSQAIQGKRNRCSESKEKGKKPRKGKIEDDTLQSKAPEIEHKSK